MTLTESQSGIKDIQRRNVVTVRSRVRQDVNYLRDDQRRFKFICIYDIRCAVIYNVVLVPAKRQFIEASSAYAVEG